MKRIRINNDIRIQWNINQKGGDIDLTSFDSKVTLIDPNNRPCKIDVTVKEDYILATFHAADQHVLGTYYLMLTLNLGEKSRITTDTYAFALVARTDEETDDTEESPVETETAQLESEVFLDTAVLIQQFEEVKVEVEELEEKVSGRKKAPLPYPKIFPPSLKRFQQ